MNNTTLKLHLEILDKDRQKVLQKLTPLLDNFVLGGGTALALQLAHRLSFDLDFFSNKPIPKSLREKIAATIGIRNTIKDNSDELTFFTSKEIKITCLNYPFKTSFPPLPTEIGFKIFPVKQIGIQKAYTIGRRGEYRDYFDLYIILKRNYLSFSELITQTKEIYEGSFDEKLFLEQLVYFADLLNFDLTPVARENLPTPEEVKNYFERQVKAYLR